MTFTEIVQLVGAVLFIVFIFSGAILLWYEAGEMIDRYIEKKKRKDKGEE